MVLMWKVQVLDSFVLTRMNNKGKAYRPCHFFPFEHRLPSNWLWSWHWSPDPPAPITLRLTHCEISDCAWIVRTCCFRSRQMINWMSIKEKKMAEHIQPVFPGKPSTAKATTSLYRSWGNLLGTRVPLGEQGWEVTGSSWVFPPSSSAASQLCENNLGAFQWMWASLWLNEENSRTTQLHMTLENYLHQILYPFHLRNWSLLVNNSGIF